MYSYSPVGMGSSFADSRRTGSKCVRFGLHGAVDGAEADVWEIGVGGWICREMG